MVSFLFKEQWLSHSFQRTPGPTLRTHSQQQWYQCFYQWYLSLLKVKSFSHAIMGIACAIGKCIQSPWHMAGTRNSQPSNAALLHLFLERCLAGLATNGSCAVAHLQHRRIMPHRGVSAFFCFSLSRLSLIGLEWASGWPLTPSELNSPFRK